MTEYIYASVIEELVPLFGYGLLYGLGLSSVIAALSWIAVLFSKLMHKII